MPRRKQHAEEPKYAPRPRRLQDIALDYEAEELAMQTAPFGLRSQYVAVRKFRASWVTDDEKWRIIEWLAKHGGVPCPPALDSRERIRLTNEVIFEWDKFVAECREKLMRGRVNGEQAAPA